PTQNIRAAESIIDESFSAEAKEALEEAKAKFGGGASVGQLDNKALAGMRGYFEKKFGKEHKSVEAIKGLENIVNTNSLKQKQQNFLELIRSDKDGNTLSYLLEIVKDDVRLQNNLKNMLNYSTLQVENNLKNLNINPGDIKTILDEFEAGNKEAFKRVEDEISKIYDDNFKVVLDQNEFIAFKKELETNGVLVNESLDFLSDLEKNVFNPNGVSFTQLNNFRKNLNFYIYNKDKSPNFVNAVKRIAETRLKAEIDRGIDNIFKELPSAYENIRKLYSQSLKDYAEMKSVQEDIKHLKLQDKNKAVDKVLDNLIKFAKGQGQNGANNLEPLKKYLTKDNEAFLEMQIMQRLFNEALVQNEKAKLKVFDSEAFLEVIKKLDTTFKSKEAKDFLELVEGFNTLYKNDALIAANLAPGATGKISSSIATSVQGAAQQKITKGLFDVFIRLLPEKVGFGFMQKGIQGASLRYHLKKALSRSLNYDDFKLKLENQIQKAGFNSETKKLLDEFLGSVDEVNLARKQSF
ncbi:hypothetical protein DMB92_09145, partial [Campylobacter sp. MIT 99-7217]|uniref:hypothetical protein n=1 Tax=Campylobacter sp. MIT 99-7217 TaxID=535091 RepID=UPI00163C980D